jgi:hypothetical protein
MSRLLSMLALATLATASVSANAAVIAYYRFDNDPGAAPGVQVQPTSDSTAPATSPIKDEANGNNMKTFNDTTGPIYNTNVPFNPVPQTGAANNLSGGYYRNGFIRDTYSQGSTGTGPNGTTLNDHNFANFTIEASVKFYDLGGYETFLGRDSDATLGLLYFQKRADNTLGFTYTDSNNVNHVIDSTVFVQSGTWYSLAAVGDGTTTSLYLLNPSDNTYSLIGSTAGTGLVVADQNWTLGRGWFNGPADWVDAEIDEVRISDTALPTTALLGATVIPEPATLAFAPALLLLASRKRRD